MKKILAISIMSVAMASEPYIGLIVSMSNADKTKVDCRGSVGLMAGMSLYEVENFKVNAELRGYLGLGNDYHTYGAYLKPEYKRVYALIGCGKTEYKDVSESYSGMRYGVGVNILDNFYADVIYRQDESDTALSVWYRYNF